MANIKKKWNLSKKSGIVHCLITDIAKPYYSTEEGKKIAEELLSLRTPKEKNKNEKKDA